LNENGTLDDRYLEWLYKKVGPVGNRNPARTYWHLARQLYTHKFVWFVPNDDNRAMDGVDLRFEFFEEAHIKQDDDSMWILLECSMLEMFIALSQRVSYQSYGSDAEWFWKMMENLDLRQYTDLKYNQFVEQEVKETLDRVNQRTYDPDGTGGVFPLVSSHRDQRQVELWYQASAYLQEGSFVANGP
jgi:hypothetical protein